MQWKTQQPGPAQQSQVINIGIPFRPVGWPVGVPATINKALTHTLVPPPPLPLPGEGLKRAVNYYADYGGCGFWRMIWPEYCLNAYQRAVIMGSSTMITDTAFYMGMNCVKFQRQATKPQAVFMESLRTQIANNTGLRMIYEIDDVVFKDDIPDYNRCKDAFNDDEIVQNILHMMNQVDEITVTCDYMREYYMHKTGHKNVTVIPNYPPKFWAGTQYNRDHIARLYDEHKKRPRIGYTGSGTHFDVMNRTNQLDDFTHVVDQIIKTRHKYQWVFMGGMPLRLKPYVDNGEIEFVQWAPLLDYPNRIVDLNVNCLIAPLIDNEFNKCKSNIKHLEGATQGIPVICQDLVTYSSSDLKFTTGDEMIDLIDMVVKDHQTYMKESDTAYAYAQTMFLEDHLDEHYEIYFTSADDPRPALSKLNKRFKSSR